MAGPHRLLLLAWGGFPTPYKPAWRAAACPSRRSEPAARLHGVIAALRRSAMVAERMSPGKGERHGTVRRFGRVARVHVNLRRRCGGGRRVGGGGGVHPPGHPPPPLRGG